MAASTMVGASIFSTLLRKKGDYLLDELKELLPRKSVITPDNRDTPSTMKIQPVPINLAIKNI